MKTATFSLCLDFFLSLPALISAPVYALQVQTHAESGQSRHHVQLL